MFKRLFTAAVVAAVAGAFTAAPVLAGHCPKDVKKINAAMSKIPEEKKRAVKDAVVKGMLLHESGRHGEALKVLHKTMKAVGIEH